MNVDALDTTRWNHYAEQDPPFICSQKIGMTTNDDEIMVRMTVWCDQANTSYDEDDPGMPLDEVFTASFNELIIGLGNEFHVDSMTRVAFPAALQEEQAERVQVDSDEPPLPEVDREALAEELVSDETLLDTVDVPGLPERRAAWRKLPQRVRIAIRRLRRQFGHCPRNVLVSLLRAARVEKQYVEAVKLHRCTICEDNAPKGKSHKTSLPYEYRFGACLGIDLLEIKDSTGAVYTCLNMVDMGTTFQQLHVIRKGHNATSAQVIKTLSDRWFSWSGFPKQIVCDRGLHFRGELPSFCGRHGIQMRNAPPETPEAIGRVERHGGIAKAMMKKMCAEVQPYNIEQMQRCANEICLVKNSTARVGGFSPSQWVLGQNPRGTPTFMNEEALADLGAVGDAADPESMFMIQHEARAAAKRAFVYLDTNKRIARAMLKNAAPIKMVYQVGDVVSFRKDNNTGGKTKWSVASRVIGHEGERDIWVLCENTPVLVSAHNLRPANDAEALAHSILQGQPIVPDEVIGESQRFVDARSREEQEQTPEVENPEQLVEVPFPERMEVIDEEGEEVGEEEESRAESSNRRMPIRRENPTRRVRQRTEGEMSTASGGASTVSAEIPASADSMAAPGQPSAWPNPRDSLNDLPEPLRRHFETQRNQANQANRGIVGMATKNASTPMGPRSRFVAWNS